MPTEKILTGYPSIDKPWLKYYSEEAINAKMPECTIYEYLWENNKDHLDDVALIYFNRKITYKELFENIDKTAKAFVGLGVKKGDFVTIQSLSLPQVIYMIYALSKIGAVANLIYATSTPAEVTENLNETKSKIYVTIDSIYEKLKTQFKTPYLTKTIILSVADEMSSLLKFGYNLKNKAPKLTNGELSWKAFLNCGVNKEVPINGKNEDLVVMVYTGGTTGKSKGVMLSNYNLNVAALQYLYCGFERNKTYLSVLPPFIAFGITVSMHMPLSFGLQTVLGVCVDPADIAGFVEKNTINYIICGTMQAEKMSINLSEKKDLSSLICFSVGGDVLTPKLESKLNDFLKQHNSKLKVAQGYAMSETSASTACSSYTPESIIHRNGTIGIPLVYTNIKIVDIETNEELTYNKDGEICIETPCTMMGYFKNEEETANVLRKHNDGKTWVHTGDIGSVDEDGFIKITGRIKRMIMTFENGVFHKVFPKLLEDEYLKNKFVKSIAVVGKTNLEKTNDLIAFVVAENGIDKEKLNSELISFTKEKFETYEQPSKFVFVEKLPLTTIGKVDYRALEKEAEKL